jgi:hypothetical protein
MGSGLQFPAVEPRRQISRGAPVLARTEIVLDARLAAV